MYVICDVADDTKKYVNPIDIDSTPIERVPKTVNCLTWNFNNFEVN